MQTGLHCTVLYLSAFNQYNRILTVVTAPGIPAGSTEYYQNRTDHTMPSGRRITNYCTNQISIPRHEPNFVIASKWTVHCPSFFSSISYLAFAPEFVDLDVDCSNLCPGVLTSNELFPQHRRHIGQLLISSAQTNGVGLSFSEPERKIVEVCISLCHQVLLNELAYVGLCKLLGVGACTELKNDLVLDTNIPSLLHSFR